MGRKLLFALGVVAALALILVRLPRDDAEPGQPTAADPVATERVLEPPAKVEEPVARAAIAPEKAPVPDSGDNRLSGQVTDTRGHPVGGAEIKLESLQQAFATAHTPFAFETTTGADGRFTFHIPRLHAAYRIRVEPSPYHGLASRDSVRGGLPTMFGAGDHDAGTFTLLVTGAIEGRVLDEEGAPVEGASVELLDSPGGYASFARTDREGEFLLGHVPAGKRRLEVRAVGFVAEQTHRTILVRTGEAAPGFEIRLRRAGSITGKFVDQDGKALAGVGLDGWPEGGGWQVSARSRDDGSFTLWLSADVPYSVTAELDGYAGYGPVSHAPGTQVVEIVLARHGEILFAVVDAQTGEPVESFGLALIDADSSAFPGVGPPVREHPGGVAERLGKPGVHDYVVLASGYAPQRRAVTDARRQVVRLEPAATLRGRLVHDGAPVPFPRVRLERDSINAEEDEIWWDGGADLDDFDGRVRGIMGSGNGRFEFDGLAGGTYKVLLKADGVAPLVLRRVSIAPGVGSDLGEVEAHAAAAIAGRIRVRAGLSPAGVPVALGDSYPDYGNLQHADAQGGFRFGGLAAGTHRVWVLAKEGVVSDMNDYPVELEPGEVLELELDLTDRAAGHVEVEVRLNDWPAEGVHVRAIALESGASYDVGWTEADGVASAWLPCRGEVRFEVSTPRRLVLGRSEEVLRPLPGQHDSVELSFDAGYLTVLVPADYELGLPMTSLHITHADGEPVAPSLTLMLSELTAPEGEPFARVELGPARPGEYTVAIPGGHYIVHGEGGEGTVDVVSLAGEVVVSADAHAECTLAETP